MTNPPSDILEALARRCEEARLKADPHRTSVIRGVPGEYSEDPRVAVNQWMRDAGEPPLITIGMFLGMENGAGLWKECEFTPEQALALIGVFLAKPAVKEALARSQEGEG